MTNTSIKLAGGTSHADTLAMSREMNTSPEFVKGMTKQQRQTNFATFVRNVTPQAMKLSIPFGALESMPQMPEDNFEILRNVSRKRLSPERKTQTVTTEAEGASQGFTLPPQDEEDFWEETE